MNKLSCVQFGDRVILVTEDVLNELNLKHGQTINSSIVCRILEINIAKAQAKIAIDNANNK